ncbi:hypothetical protein H6758_03435 [Candidatus Nomurabacteria bacterium]|nr:hypothetical protein [Candidatus Nomurabacteria bacterium]
MFWVNVQSGAFVLAFIEALCIVGFFCESERRMQLLCLFQGAAAMLAIMSLGIPETHLQWLAYGPGILCEMLAACALIDITIRPNHPYSIK